MIVSPPRLVGIRTVAEIHGVTPDAMRHKMARGYATAGYLGKIGARHTWNLHELVASMFSNGSAMEQVIDQLANHEPRDPLDDVLCVVPGCDRVQIIVGFCDHHLRYLGRSWARAGRSQLVTVQLVALCRWVVDRNAHIVLPADFDPWAPVCMTPGCDNETNSESWHGPLCRPCTAKFWNNMSRVRPRHWKGAA